MFHHIVLLRLSKTDAAFHARVDEYVAQLRDELSHVRSYTLVRNEAQRAAGYEWAVISSFDSSEDHDLYQASDIHQKIQTFMEPYIEAMIVCNASVSAES